MSSLLLLAMVASEGPAESVAKTFGVDWPHLIAQIISFCIVCVVLYRFAYRPILNMLEERRNQIAQGIAERESIKAELARTESERHEVLLRANEQAAKLIEEARAASVRLQDQELQKAMASAEQILRQAQEAAQQEHAHMLAAVKQQVGGLVVETTAAVTRKVLTEEDQRRLAEEAARQLAA
jgi:F-type H+-transporting ATPase subunit b